MSDSMNFIKTMTDSINFIKKHWSILILILFNIIQVDIGKINFEEGKISSFGNVYTVGFWGILLVTTFGTFLASAFEEYSVRGGLQWLIGKVTSNIYIIVGLASIVFSLTHIPFGSGGLGQVYYSFLFGVYFGTLRIEGMSLLKLSLFHFSINFPGQFVNNEIDFGDYETISIIILTLPILIYGFRRLYLLSKLTTKTK